MPPLLTSTSYFPCATYMAECLRAEKIVIETHGNYVKQSLRNRFEIAGPNGRQKLVVPVVKTTGNHTLVKDIRIAYDLPWQKVHLRSVTAAYNKSPFLLFYLDHFITFFETKYDFLIDLNTEVLLKVLDLFGSRIPVEFTSDYEKEPQGVKDMRDILVSKHRPSRHTLHTLHTPPTLPPYTQPFSERYGFLEDLSVVDLIFCLGPETREYLAKIT